MAEPARALSSLPKSGPPPPRPPRTPTRRLATSRPSKGEAALPVRLRIFNRLGRDDAVALVKPCFEVERWWSSVVDARPCRDLETLLEVARTAAQPLTRRELELALAAYLGLRVDDWLPVDDAPSLETGESAAQLRERIAEDSRVYLARFGRPFVTRTAGRSVPGVADQLRRLAHDATTESGAATESGATAAALRQIALLALVRRVAA